MNIRNKLKHPRNLSLYAILLVWFAGYLFFFTSTLTFGASETYQVSKLHELRQFEGNRSVTVWRWDYSPTQGLMEVELLFENGSFDGMDRYLFEAVTRPAGTLEIKPVIEESSFVILHISGIPQSFTEISLRLKVDDEQYSEIVRLYSNIDAVTQTENIRVKTKTEYMTDRLRGNIAQLKEEIAGVEAHSSELETRIRNIEEKNTALEDGKRYQTAAEIEQANLQIERNNNEIERLKDEVLTNRNEILECRERIRNAQRQVADLTAINSECVR